MPGGRPKFEITPKIMEKVEVYAAQGLTLKEIAHCLGISYQTLNTRKKELAEFDSAIERGQAKGMATISNALFVAGKDGNITAQIFYLKNRSPKNWKDRHSTELSGPDDGPVKITVELVSKGD